ncbi:MAG: hypothetical protein R3C56_24420 [Pirellulaceae bacterium]
MAQASGQTLRSMMQFRSVTAPQQELDQRSLPSSRSTANTATESPVQQTIGLAPATTLTIIMH